MEKSLNTGIKPRDIAGIILFLAALSLTSLYSYDLFHSLAELFSVVIIFSIFVLGWNSRRFTRDNDFFLLISIAYLFVGVIIILHTLAYKGVGIFPEYGSNLPTQLWIAGRYLQSISILAATFFISWKLMIKTTLATYSVVVLLCLASIFFWKIFPDAFIEGEGLTAFKIVSEYIICLILLLSIFMLYRQRSKFDKSVFKFLIASIAATILSELAFTLYTDVYGIANMVGHLLSIVAFYLIYKAIVEIGIVSPFRLLFRDLRQHEIELERSEEWFSSLFKESPIGKVVYNSEGKLVDINLSCIDMFDISDMEKIKGLQLFNDPTISDRQKDILRRGETAKYDLVIMPGKYREYDLYKHVKPGIKNLNVMVKPLFTGDKKLLEGYLMQVQDITEPKRVEQLKDEFISMVSHEMRTPLTIIIGSLDTALSEKESLQPEERENLLEQALQESHSLSHILENLLELSRAQANRLALHNEPLEINVVIKSVIDRFPSTSIHRLILDLSEDMPEVEADRTRLERIIYNLVENAVKYSPSGGDIKITVRQENDHLTISIKDQGIGISSQDQALLFQLFQRLEKPGIENAVGTGIGLVVCKRLVEAHGGKIWVESIPDEGSTFSFTLPLRHNVI